MNNKSRHLMVVLATIIGSFVIFGWDHIALSKEEDYPKKEITVYIGFPPGGPDVHGRVVCKVMEKILGQPMVVVNKPGASSAIATAYVANSKPDGYTLLYGLFSYAVLEKIDDPSLPFSVEKLAFLGSSHTSYIYLTVRSDSPWKTYEQFVDYAKKNPVKFGSIGTRSLNSATQAHFAEVAGFKKLIQVPYAGGGKTVTGLLSGEVEAITAATPAAPYVKSGNFKWLVYFGPERNAIYSDVPAIAEKEKKYKFFLPGGNHFLGPAGMPPGVVEKLTKAFREAVRSKEVEDIFKSVGYVPNYRTPQQCVDYWKLEENFFSEFLGKAKK
jgi:tripartite-type tricarboxylate transporter receptor subunit TctC